MKSILLAAGSGTRLYPITKKLGRKLSVTFEEGLSQTIDWYLLNGRG